MITIYSHIPCFIPSSYEYPHWVALHCPVITSGPKLINNMSVIVVSDSELDQPVLIEARQLYSLNDVVWTCLERRRMDFMLGFCYKQIIAQYIYKFFHKV